MNSKNYEVDNIEGGVPVKRWTRGVAVEDSALRQLANVARLPFVHKWVASTKSRAKLRPTSSASTTTTA
jgi:tRNA-splicing ligase RtcB (3'-phosphate/5'-hydroxy nucleic acid ligase)